MARMEWSPSRMVRELCERCKSRPSVVSYADMSLCGRCAASLAEERSPNNLAAPAPTIDGKYYSVARNLIKKLREEDNEETK